MQRKKTPVGHPRVKPTLEDKPTPKIKKKARQELSYHQNSLYLKINEYRIDQGLPPLSMEGHCHGLVLRWLKAKDKKKVRSKFYRPRTLLIKRSVKKLKTLPKNTDNKNQVDVYIERVSHCQNPENSPTSRALPTPLHQQDVAKVIHAERQINLDKRYSEVDLIGLFDRLRKNHNMFTVTSKSSKRHTVGVYVGSTSYRYFDANHTSKTAQRIFSSTYLVEQIQVSLYDNLKLPRPYMMDLHVKFVSNPSKHQQTNITKVQSTPRAKFGLFEQKNKKSKVSVSIASSLRYPR